MAMVALGVLSLKRCSAAAGLTRNVAVPLSAGLLTDVEGNHDALTAYRLGDPGSIVHQFAAASLSAVPNARTLTAALDQISADWHEATRPRPGSVKQRLLHFAVERPAFTADLAATILGMRPSNVYRYLKELQEREVLAFNAEYQGPAVWRAPEVLAAIDEFARWAGRRSR